MFPSGSEAELDSDLDAIEARLQLGIPQERRELVASLLEQLGVPEIPPDTPRAPVFALGPSATAARQHIDSAVRHGASLVVSALGPPPRDSVDEAHEHGMLVGAMVGSPRHVAHQLDAGVDLVIAQGSEAAAHAGDISTMVLVPEVVDLAAPRPVLAAGGIATGRQFLAARALGADGVWTGSMWRVAAESRDRPGVVERLLAAGSADTVRSRCMTGKLLRQLRTPWTDAWEAPESPGALPMPLQRMLQADAEQRFEHYERDDLVVSPIGQVVGQLSQVRPAAELLNDLVAGYAAALAALDLG
jgi:NAD(P)H-dependent flavin oxidoreductase YrpB (nitropropane dioxygenase family)